MSPNIVVIGKFLIELTLFPITFIGGYVKDFLPVEGIGQAIFVPIQGEFMEIVIETFTIWQVAGK